MNSAAMGAHTESDHILVAQVVRDECQSHREDFVDQGEITPKRFATPICVHEVKWQ